jgi:hypothetical protein
MQAKRKKEEWLCGREQDKLWELWKGNLCERLLASLPLIMLCV